MASEFIPLNANDTKELRKELGLPVTKAIIYWYKEKTNSWRQTTVIDYDVVETYEPSGCKSVLITLENGKQVCILGDYLSDMQKPSFLSDIGDDSESKNEVSEKIGKRVEQNVDTYIVVDLETTGTNHNKDKIIEIGAIKYVGGEETERFNVLVKNDVNISKHIESLTRISDDMLVKSGIEAKNAYIQFKKFVGNDIIVGHNFAAFDSKFLEDAYMRELGMHFPNDFIDTLYLAKKTLPNLQHHTLESLSKHYSIDYSKAHRAVEDCVINHLVYEYLTFNYLLCEKTGKGYVISDKISADTDDEIVNENNLIEVNVSEEWQKIMSSKFETIESELGLFKDSLSIMANVGKDGNVSSYAICIYEPDLVEDRRDSRRYTVLARVKENIIKSNANKVEVYSKYFEGTKDKKRMENDSEEFINCLIDCIKKGIENYVPKSQGFACCSRYQECSNFKKCIHPNVLYAKSCKYRKNVELGNVFY